MMTGIGGSILIAVMMLERLRKRRASALAHEPRDGGLFEPIGEGEPSL